MGSIWSPDRKSFVILGARYLQNAVIQDGSNEEIGVYRIRLSLPGLAGLDKCGRDDVAKKRLDAAIYMSVRSGLQNIGVFKSVSDQLTISHGVDIVPMLNSGLIKDQKLRLSPPFQRYKLCIWGHPG